MTRFVPAAVKQPLKRWYFSHLLASALASVRSDGEATDDDLTRLRMGWANDGWDAKPVFLKEVISALKTTTGPVLECGSGLSTVVMAALAPERHRVSLENHANWAHRVRAVLHEHGLTADVRVAPLTDRDGLHWYSAVGTLPTGIGLVICDGPDSYGRGRYPVLPLVRHNLAPGAVILFDDAAAEGQPEVLDSWAREFDTRVDRRHLDGVDYAVVTVP